MTRTGPHIPHYPEMLTLPPPPLFFFFFRRKTFHIIFQLVNHTRFLIHHSTSGEAGASAWPLRATTVQHFTLTGTLAFPLTGF